MFYLRVGFDPKRLFMWDVDADAVADLVSLSSVHVTIGINTAARLELPCRR